MFEINGDGRAVNPLVRRLGFGLQHCRKLQCQGPICFWVADKDICHGKAPDPQDPPQASCYTR